MKNMKKLIALIMALAIIMGSLTSCNNTTNDVVNSPNIEESQSVETNTPKPTSTLKPTPTPEPEPTPEPPELVSYKDGYYYRIESFAFPIHESFKLIESVTPTYYMFVNGDAFIEITDKDTEEDYTYANHYTQWDFEPSVIPDNDPLYTLHYGNDYKGYFGARHKNMVLFKIV